MKQGEKFEFIKPGQIRTRFAPSPTGFLHIGSARTALFNYLFAQKNQGRFILRLEDTDVERSKPKFEKDIIENLKWLGIEWNEGPYKQSERGDIYAKYLEKLIKEGKAYYCFCSEEELEAKRQEKMSRGEPARYNGKCAKLSKKEVEKKLEEGKKFIIRFKVPAKKISFNDIVRGKIEFDAGLIGDISIAKDLSAPLYNFAVVVDDFEMEISHVIRGEDLLPNTPVQIILQEALGFPRPQYSHLPLIFGPDRTKLSKRHGAVSVAEYKKQGYLSETLINFLAFLGWNPGTEREIFSLSSLIKEFSMEKVQKGGAIFNIKRLDFLNGFYIRQKSLDRLTELCLPYFEGKTVDKNYLKRIIAIYQERLKKLSEIVELTDFFFKEKLDYDKKLLQWKEMNQRELSSSLEKLIEILSKIEPEDWTKENLERVLLLEAEKVGDRGYLLWPLRVALTGKEASAGPFEIAEILNKEKTLKRLKEAKNLL